jgi:23S rRNA-/tRNA-specific pseudouridylate synthase
MDDIGVERSLHLVHRLDSPTSGVLLATFSTELAVSLRKSFAERETRKTYYAIVREKGKARDGHWKDRLEEVREGGNLRVKAGRGHEALAKVTFERRRVGRLGLSLVRLEPVTGRTHQLRVQASTRGFPIVGDRIYGDFALNRKIARASRVERLCLHATSIELGFKHQGTSIKFYAESPLPRILGKLLS